MKITEKFVGAAVLLALFINSPQVSADEVETFGADFDDDDEVIPFQKENSTREDDFADDEEFFTDDEEFFVDDEDFGRVLIFDVPIEDTPTENPPTVEIFQPKESPPEETPTENPADDEDFIIIETPTPLADDERILPPSRIPELQQQNKVKQKKLKTQKPRFIKLTVDDTYTYYLDKQSVAWRRVPYSAGEYMLDVWIRMIELEPDTSDLPDDLANYIADTSNGEIELAAEKGIAFAQVDVDVMQHKKYFLEHYYLRPKNKQIQFLCELEVIGHPQNTISERAYDYKNWEYLIPGSVESTIYNMTMKEVGKSGSSEHGHMSFADFLEEYARISIR